MYIPSFSELLPDMIWYKESGVRANKAWGTHRAFPGGCRGIDDCGRDYLCHCDWGRDMVMIMNHGWV